MQGSCDAPEKLNIPREQNYAGHAKLKSQKKDMDSCTWFLHMWRRKWDKVVQTHLTRLHSDSTLKWQRTVVATFDTLNHNAQRYPSNSGDEKE
jgi:hypothetical protein